MECLLPIAAAVLMIRRKIQSMEPVWSFGFGSNMDVSFVENKKGHKVLDHAAGVVHGWRMSFNLRGMSYVEPAFANAVPSSSTDNIHGVAILLGPEDVRKLQAQERGYDIHWVSVDCYDGRQIQAFIFSRPARENDKPFPLEQQLPSRRYMNILLRGATAAGLQEEYLCRLKNQKTWFATSEIIQTRENFFCKPSELPAMSVEELMATKSCSLGGDDATGIQPGHFAYVALFGYVLKLKRENVWFKSHLGRDLTFRFTRHFRGTKIMFSFFLFFPCCTFLQEM